ncbi:VOC family protein [Streptomyces triculaminicus]|uniref:VOC family protein n=1 Tax=Streptomyces triculaminicus TaxID=2816232 RepID=UPI0033DADC56
MLTNVMYVTLYVTDQDRALRFYTEQLGLEKRIDFPGPDGRFLTVGVPGAPVEIILWAHPAAAGQPAEPVPGATPGPVILESDDLRADFKVFRDRGVAFDQPEPEDYGFGVRIDTADPDGNRISLRGRSRAGRADG